MTGTRIATLDSTLRDGAQGAGVAFSVEDKLAIVRALDSFGVDYIEAGNPASNPKDAAFFERAHSLALSRAKLCAFGSTRKKDTAVEEDRGVRALAAAGTSVVALFGKAWDMQVERVLETTAGENLRMIAETVAYFKSLSKEVIFDAEHFFDGFRANPEYALSCLRAAEQAGADVVCLCDTNGGALPEEIHAGTARAAQVLSCPVGVHCHNDAGLAVAGTLAAVRAGASHIQGTFIGIGERCGNANLSTVIANLQLKYGYGCVPAENLQRLRQTARIIAERTNVRLSPGMPYIGSAAFAHKGGMHIDGVEKCAESFEHVDPELVGNTRKLLTSEMAGRSTIVNKIRVFAPELGKDSQEIERIVARLKQLEFEGYQFEAAESSFELIVRKMLGRYHPFFELDHYRILGENGRDGSRNTGALIKVKVGDKAEITAAEGNGPVHALDSALRKALTVFYPSLRKERLTDYKVRVMEPKDGTATTVRVLIESTDGERIWTTVGVSADIIEASWIALCDSIEYKLTLDEERER